MAREVIKGLTCEIPCSFTKQCCFRCEHWQRPQHRLDNGFCPVRNCFPCGCGSCSSFSKVREDLDGRENL